MSSTPWKTDKWFVSPWNYDEEVTAKLQFPENIEIHDITLRDGEQQAGVVFTKEDKIAIAKKLDEIGVHRIEAGMPAVSDQDEAAIKAIVDLDLKAKIFAFSRCMVPDVKLAAECGVSGVVVEIPSSEHVIKYAYGWELDKAVKLSIEATLAAKDAGLYTVFFPIDFTRADVNWVVDLIEKVATEGHMDALAIVDTFGGTSPHAIPFVIDKIRQRIDKPLEPHFHDDFNMGVANTIMALAQGARVPHVTVTGIGERAGNTPMEDVVLTLLCMYGKDLGIKTEKFVELSKLVRTLAKVKVPDNRPIVGDMLYNIESGIIADWVRRCGETHPTELVPFRHDLVGQEKPKIIMGKNSGPGSILEWAERIGQTFTEDEARKVLLAVKKKSFEKKGLLNEEEFKAIVDQVL